MINVYSLKACILINLTLCTSQNLWKLNVICYCSAFNLYEVLTRIALIKSYQLVKINNKRGTCDVMYKQNYIVLICTKPPPVL